MGRAFRENQKRETALEPEDEAPSPALPRRRWTSMVLVVVLLAILGGGVWYFNSSGYRQAKAVAQLEALDAIVFYDYSQNSNSGEIAPAGPSNWEELVGQDFFYPVVWVRLNETAIRAEELALLRDLPGLKRLTLGESTGDRGMETIAQLPQLNSLALLQSSVTVKGMQSLSSLPNLTFFAYTGPNFTDEHLKSIIHWPNLTSLYLSDTVITDEGAKLLTNFPHLLELHLDGTLITDASLVYIEDLTDLKILWLSNTQITGTGFKHFSKLTSLKELHLDGNTLDMDSLDQLTSLQNLEQLNLANSNVTRRVKRSLGEKMPNASID